MDVEWFHKEVIIFVVTGKSKNCQEDIYSEDTCEIPQFAMSETGTPTETSRFLLVETQYPHVSHQCVSGYQYHSSASVILGAAMEVVTNTTPLLPHYSCQAARQHHSR